MTTATVTATGVSSSHPTADVVIRAADLGDRARWLLARQQGVTATDSRVLRGHPYSNESIFTKWQSKVQTIDPDLAEEGDAPLAWELGSDLEPVIAKHASRHFDTPMTKVGMLRHKEHGHLLSSPDMNTGDGGHCEMKATATHYLRNYQDAESDYTNDAGWTLPPAWFDQCIHQLMVSGRSHVHVAALITDKRTFTFWTVERDEIAESAARHVADRFWFDHVVPRVPPPIDWDTITNAEVTARFPIAAEGMVVVPADQSRTLYLLDRRRSLKAEISAAEKQLKPVETELKAIAAQAEHVLDTDGNVLYSYVNRDRKGYTVAPSTFRQFANVAKVGA